MVKLAHIDLAERARIGLQVGQTICVWQRIQEKGKTRLQAFEGLVIATKHGRGASATFTVRRVASGVGTEKIFPLHSPNISRIEILRRAKVRRAKLYHIRHKAAKEVRRAMRNLRQTETAPAADGAMSLTETTVATATVEV